MTSQFVGISILIILAYLVYKLIPPMDPKLKAPLSEMIDWDEIGIDPSDLQKRKEYLDQLLAKVKSDYERVYKK
jgi:hypothetical protein